MNRAVYSSDVERRAAMAVFFLIIKNVIFPIFLLIGVGALLHRKFVFDLNTLSKLNTYFLLPAVCFVNIYEGSISGKLIAQLMMCGQGDRFRVPSLP